MIYQKFRPEPKATKKLDASKLRWRHLFQLHPGSKQFMGDFSAGSDASTTACDPISPTIAKHIIRRSCYNRPGSLYQHQFIVYIFRLSLSLVSGCVSHIYQSCLSQLFQRLANYRLGQILLHGCQVALSPPNHLIAICLLDIGQIYFTFGDLEKTRLAIWTNTFSNLDN